MSTLKAIFDEYKDTDRVVVDAISWPLMSSESALIDDRILCCMDSGMEFIDLFDLDKTKADVSAIGDMILAGDWDSLKLILSDAGKYGFVASILIPRMTEPGNYIENIYFETPGGFRLRAAVAVRHYEQMDKDKMLAEKKLHE